MKEEEESDCYLCCLLTKFKTVNMGERLAAGSGKEGIFSCIA